MGNTKENPEHIVFIKHSLQLKHLSKLRAWICPTQAAKNGTETYIQDAIIFSFNCPLEWFVELVGDTTPWSDTGKSLDVSLIPSYDYPSALSRACLRFGIFFGDFHSAIW